MELRVFAARQNTRRVSTPDHPFTPFAAVLCENTPGHPFFVTILFYWRDICTLKELAPFAARSTGHAAQKANTAGRAKR